MDTSLRIPMKSDTDSDLIRTGFRPMSDSVPEFAGQDSGGIRTAIRDGPDKVPVHPDSVPGHPDSFSAALSGVVGRDRE